MSHLPPRQHIHEIRGNDDADGCTKWNQSKAGACSLLSAHE
jgi:hypothetical protein